MIYINPHKPHAYYSIPFFYSYVKITKIGIDLKLERCQKSDVLFPRRRATVFKSGRLRMRFLAIEV
jgi:hypothetical protein